MFCALYNLYDITMKFPFHIMVAVVVTFIVCTLDKTKRTNEQKKIRHKIIPTTYDMYLE